MNRRAYTLVELLVSIAVVGILAAMLLPTLNHGKQAAWRAQCGSNLRQLGMAAELYWDDNGWTFFNYSYGPTNGGTLYWFGWLFGLSLPEGQRPFDLSVGKLAPYVDSSKVRLCPALYHSLVPLKLKATNIVFSYGYNRSLSSTMRVCDLRQPTETALFADAAQVNDFQPPASPSHPMLEEFYYVDVSASYPNGHFRHRRKANVGFADGHVDWEKPVPGSIDLRLPSQFVGRLRPEILLLP
jgi:prepilin-type N-terminal cleavage/methylation domain-containing protein/prepilin-type processing-associated H-X9-DG protein